MFGGHSKLQAEQQHMDSGHEGKVYISGRVTYESHSVCPGFLVQGQEVV